MEIMRMVHLEWQRGTCRERTFTAKLAGGSTQTFLKDTNRRVSWPDCARVCMERETQRQFGETLGQKC